MSIEGDVGIVGIAVEMAYEYAVDELHANGDHASVVVDELFSLIIRYVNVGFEKSAHRAGKRKVLLIGHGDINETKNSLDLDSEN